MPTITLRDLRYWLMWFCLAASVFSLAGALLFWGPLIETMRVALYDACLGYDGQDLLDTCFARAGHGADRTRFFAVRDQLPMIALLPFGVFAIAFALLVDVGRAPRELPYSPVFATLLAGLMLLFGWWPAAGALGVFALLAWVLTLRALPRLRHRPPESRRRRWRGLRRAIMRS